MNELQVTFNGQSYTFEPGQTARIGRSPDNGIIVSDPTVSRQHAQLSWGKDGWVYQNLGRARTFHNGQDVSRIVVSQPMDFALASPQGPVVRIQPPTQGGQQAASADSPQAAWEAGAPVTRIESPQDGIDAAPADPQVAWQGSEQQGQGQPQGWQGAPQQGWQGAPQAAGWQGAPQAAGWQGAPQAAGWQGAPQAAGWQGAEQGGQQPGWQGAPHPGGVPAWPGRGAASANHELATAIEILVPLKSWLKDAGWRQGLRLLVIAYALLPLLFLAFLSSSDNLSAPGLAYSLYIAPLWAIAFWMLLRPGKVRALEIEIAAAIVVWVTIWLNIVTININDQLVNGVHDGNFLAALAAGYNEEITKALPVLLAALILLKYRSTKLGVRMWMLLGTISGLTFGVLEERSYTEMAIARVATAHVISQADAGVLDFAFRVFVDGFQHAIWAGVSAFFIGMAVNYPRRRWQLVLFGVSIAALLHALNDWSLAAFNSYWPWIFIQAVSLLLFLGYTMSATSIERQVRQTPLFRGESMLMEAVPEADETGRP